MSESECVMQFASCRDMCCNGSAVIRKFPPAQPFWFRVIRVSSIDKENAGMAPYHRARPIFTHLFLASITRSPEIHVVKRNYTTTIVSCFRELGHLRQNRNCCGMGTHFRRRCLARARPRGASPYPESGTMPPD